MNECLHMNFNVVAAINRVEREPGEVAGFCADIRITCTGCQLPFVFLGVRRIGLSFEQPMTNADATELRQPIAPSLDWSNGEPLPSFAVERVL